MADPALRKLQNQYFVGAYQSAVTSAISLPSTPETDTLKRSFLYRCYLAQKKHSLVIKELGTNAQQLPDELKVLQLVAKLPTEGAALLKDIQSVAKESKSPLVSVLAAEALVQANQLKEAMEALAPHCMNDLESSALLIQILLSYNRVDLAEKQLARMKELEEDSVLTMLAEAWVCIFTGGEKIPDAFYIYQELMETYNVTAKLLNNQAICQLLSDKVDEAEKILADAYQKSHDDPDVLANSTAFASFLGKPSELISRYLSELSHENPNHPYAKEIEKRSALFDTCAAKFMQ